MATVAKDAETRVEHSANQGWIDRFDQLCERLGDALNPILVKETRQALKSRQFVTTFSILLFAALGWTIIGSLLQMPEIYTTPSAPRMLIGYYVVLAIPLLMVVPLAAYRSLEGEIDDGTLELLSITTLSAWQIVLGKLASACLQMLLYYVALFPCVAYAYTLRGVDLPTTLLMMGILVVAATLLTVVALFFAPLARTRTGRISTLLAVMLILLASEWGLAALVIGMIYYGNPLSAEQFFFCVTASLLISLALGHLLLTATAAQLTPESENRSTPIRISLMVLTGTILGLGALAVQTLETYAVSVAVMFTLGLAALWVICGSMLAAESPVITPRIRRELPSSFLARVTLTWLTPGPATGLVFATVNIIVVASIIWYGIDYTFDQPSLMTRGLAESMLKRFTIATASYVIGFLVAIRVVVGIVRIRNHPRVEVGLAAMAAVAVMAALTPYAIGLHLNDYLAYPYSAWQVTNWAWTLFAILNGTRLDGTVLIILIAATIAFFICLLTMPQLVLPRRIATPQRVRQEVDAIRRS